jgi:hypothetical protein
MGTKTRKALVRTLIGLMIFVTAILCIRAVFNYAMGRRLENGLRRAKAAGIPLTSLELLPGCSEKDNAGRIWKAVEALFLTPKDQERTAMTGAWEAVANGLPFDVQIRERVMPWIISNNRIIGLIEEASGMSCFLYDGSDKSALSKRYPDSIKLIQAARLLAIDAVFRAESGEWKEALEECRSGIRLFTKILASDSCNLMMSLVVTHNVRSLLIAMNRIVRDRDMDSETLASWIHEIDVDSWKKGFVRGVRGERVFILNWGRAFISGNPESVDALTPWGRAYIRLRNWLVRPLLKAQALWNLNRSLELEALLPLTYHLQSPRLSEWAKGMDPRPWYLKPVGEFLANYQSVFLKEAILEATMLTTRTGLACKIYKNKYGRYPENLDALVPEILDRVPIDPFTDKPLVYKLTSDEVLIYSLGSNEKDDGGRQTYNLTQLVMEKDDDWAWREKIQP